MSLATGVSIITRSQPPGRRRNIAFSSLGVAQPLGYSVGLVAGGIAQTSTWGWRLGYYACAVALGVFVITGCASLPSNKRPVTRSTFHRVVADTDWIGIVIASSGLGIISYTCTHV